MSNKALARIVTAMTRLIVQVAWNAAIASAAFASGNTRLAEKAEKNHKAYLKALDDFEEGTWQSPTN